MGHAKISNSLGTINTDLLDIELLDIHASIMGKKPQEIYQRHERDFMDPKYVDFSSRGIFHLQVGGGENTGVVSAVNNNSNWMRAKLAAYSDNPIKFEECSIKIVLFL